MWIQTAWEPAAWLSTSWDNCGADEALRSHRGKGRGRKSVRPLPYYVGLDVTLSPPALPDLTGRATVQAPTAPTPSRARAIAAPGTPPPVSPSVARVPAPRPIPVVKAAVTMSSPVLPVFQAVASHRDIEGEEAQTLMDMIEAYD